MSLFWKPSHKTDTPAASDTAAGTPLPPPTERHNLTAEEIARNWFEQKTGLTMPEEIKSWLKSMARIEAQRVKTNENLLDAQQLLKMEEARKLCETKLSNTEQSLKHVHEQIEWLRRFAQLTSSLEQSQAHLYEVNKQYASLMDQTRALERFEMFEAVQGRFQRIRALETELQANKRLHTAQAHAAETATRQATDIQKQFDQAHEQRCEAEKHLALMQEPIAEGHRIQGSLCLLDMNETFLAERVNRLRQERIALQKEADEMKQDLELLVRTTDEKRLRRQVLEVHQVLLEQGNVVFLLLDTLLETRLRREQLQQQLAHTIRRQNEENETLNRLFTQHQDLDAEIHILQNELEMHRKSNQGQDSYTLQTRAMQLKSQKQQLLSALALWRHIATGYANIDEYNQRITRMRLHTEHEASNIQTLETELKRLRDVCEEKKYAYTLSKSQNVIQLRGDLREGTGCSVCGATHHPYHSDTMLEQSKLIADMKSDYEQVAAELRNKEEQLKQMQLAYAEECGCLHTEREALEQSRLFHEANIREWKQYRTLDRSFNDCSASTNMEAREMMLKQLIEKIGQDAEEAQKELDIFTFHQGHINRINEHISEKEADKSNIVTRLNEVNTGCQVMAGQVEQLQTRIAKTNEKHSRLYEELDKLISLADWYKEWLASPESLKIRIQQYMEQWHRLNEEIRKEQNEAVEKSLRLQAAQEALHTSDRHAATLEEDLARTSQLKKENENTLRKVLGAQEPKNVYHTHYQALLQAREHEEELLLKCKEARLHEAEARGALQTTLQTDSTLEQEIAAERSALDLWIKNFNANHPPVQYAELERVFQSETDWCALRKHIRELRIELAVTQAKVDETRSALIAHQAESARPTVQNTDDQHAVLMAQKEDLERKRSEVLKQIATYDARRQAHERAQEQLALLRQEINQKGSE